MQTTIYLLKPNWLRLLFLWVSLAVGAKTLVHAAPAGGRSAPPATPGNYVFQDRNQNGIFDGIDTGISGTRIYLYDNNGVLVESTTTTSTGQFSFTSTLQASSSYNLRIRATDAPAGLKLTSAKQGSNDGYDSDANMIGSTAVIAASTDASGQFVGYLGFGYQAGDPDLTITQTSNSFSVTRGQTDSFSLTVANVGGSTASGVIVRDTLDAGMAFVSASPAATTALLGNGQTEVTWGSASTTLAAGSTLTFNVTVLANSDGVLTCEASVTTTTPDGTPRNNLSRACFSVPVRLCQGEAYVTSLSASQTNVEWFRDGVSVGTGNSLTITAAGTYSYTALSGGSDCQTSSCCPIIIYNGSVTPPTLVASFSAICPGGESTLTASNCAGTLAWSTGVSNVSSITVSPMMTTTYSVTCTPTAQDACPASSSVTITVNPSVVATVASATICDGLSTVLTANATGGSGFQYNWTPAATITSGQGTASVTVAPNTLTTYTVVVTNSTGCVTSATATVTVNPAVTATVASATICDNTSTTLTVDASGGSGFTYAWAPTATISGSSSGSAVVVAPRVATTYSVTVTNSNGCVTSTTAIVTVNPAVTAVIAATPSTTICQGNSATLTASGGAVYRWSTTPVQVGSSIIVAPSETTVYSVTATSGDQCVGVSSLTLTVNPTPVLTINSPTICQDQEAVLSLTGCAGTVRWSTGTIGTATLTVSPLQTTVYSATCALSTGCSTTISTQVTVNDAPSVQQQNIVATRATCNGGTPNSNASIALTNLQNTARAAISTADGNVTTIADFGTATAVANGAISFANLPNPAQRVTYIVRLYSTIGCFTDITVTLDPAECVCPAPKCVPVSIRKIR